MNRQHTIGRQKCICGPSAQGFVWHASALDG